ncbi:MAG: hypothetical protein L0312_28690 [Acidobacteria bacterium]|nr:hypothetical protein [Acidobacteriota bacterium]
MRLQKLNNSPLDLRNETFPSQQTAEQAKVYVLIWFDVEDYYSPESDDADMKAAELASSLGVPVTLKVVGEKARALERHGRRDAIAALSRHDIGYHSDWHSRPPTIAAYLRNMSWEEGVREFERRETQGFKDVQRIFGKDPICFGQPGFSWAPQSYPALKKWGIGVYLDEALHVGLPDEQPFWYQGMLHIFNLRRNTIKMEFGSAGDFRQTCRLFRSAYHRLKERGGGVISVFYHPQEFLYRDFQDVVNFGGGINTPPEAWQQAERRTPQEIRSGYEHYKNFIQFMQSHEQLSFISAGRALQLYADRALRRSFSRDEVLELARGVQSAITFQAAGQVYLSASEIFYLLAKWMVTHSNDSRCGPLTGPRTPSGPTRPAQTEPAEMTVSRAEFERALRDVWSFLEESQQIPNAIWIDTRHVSPADFLATLGEVVEHQIKNGAQPHPISVREGNFTAAQYAAQDSPALWAWPIFPEGFHAPNLMQLAQLQTWTIKPAKLSPGPVPWPTDECEETEIKEEVSGVRETAR